ncbi:MAG: fasciclin domain-containing protein [Flammeovirgaceae bacterium]
MQKTHFFNLAKIFTILLIVITSFSSCDDDSVDPVDTSNTIAGLVISSSQFTLLETAIINVSANTSTDLTTLFTSSTEYTVFAPNDAAFTAAGYDEAFLSNAANASAILDILVYHVIEGEVKASAVPAGPNASQATLSTGNNIFLTVNTQGVFVNSNKVITADIDAENGVIHEIGAVLTVPSTDIVGTAVSATGTDFTLLVTAIANASANTGTDVASVLSGTTAYTVFAPTTQAFIDAGFDYEFLSNSANAAAILDILLYHVIAGEVVADNVPAGPNASQETLLTDANIYLTNNNDGVFVNANQVIAANVDASNGVVHVIGGVLTPPSGNIVDLVSGDTDLELLLTVIQYVDDNTSENLAGTLSDASGTFTVFAPSNAAFIATVDGADGSTANGAVETAELDELGATTLAAILKTHVVSGRTFSNDLQNGGTITPLNNAESLGIDLSSGVVISSDGTSTSNVTKANIVATNGVIHKIDAVLLP